MGVSIMGDEMAQHGETGFQEPVPEGRPEKEPLQLELRSPQSRFLRASRVLQTLCGSVVLGILMWQSC